MCSNTRASLAESVMSSGAASSLRHHRSGKCRHFPLSTNAHTRFGFLRKTVTPIAAQKRFRAAMRFDFLQSGAIRGADTARFPAAVSMLHGVRRACQSAANKILALLGRKVDASRPSWHPYLGTFSHVLRRRACGKIRALRFRRRMTRAATKAMSGCRVHDQAAIAWVSGSPRISRFLAESWIDTTPFPPTMFRELQPLGTDIDHVGVGIGNGRAPNRGDASYACQKRLAN